MSKRSLSPDLPPLKTLKGRLHGGCIGAIYDLGFRDLNKFCTPAKHRTQDPKATAVPERLTARHTRYRTSAGVILMRNVETQILTNVILDHIGKYSRRMNSGCVFQQLPQN